MCQAGEWVDIKKKLPPRDTGVLVTDGKDITMCELAMNSAGSHAPYLFMVGHGFGGYEFEFDMDPENITHWMRLPAFPGPSTSGAADNPELYAKAPGIF